LLITELFKSIDTSVCRFYHRLITTIREVPEDDMLPRTVALIAKACKKAATGESRFAEDLMFDSIDLVHLVAEMEEEFNVVLNEDQLRTLRTVDDAVRVVRSLKNGGAADA